MPIRPILLIPDPRLKSVCEPVTEITDEIRTLADDMLETMYDAPGIGLAASQIGVMKRILVADVSREDEERSPMVVINPEILWSSEETSVREEGCLSIPDYYEEVERPDRIRLRYMDLDGKTQEIEAEGLLATCLQHEIDHLNGVLFLDHLSKLKRDRVMKKFSKVAKRAS